MSEIITVNLPAAVTVVRVVWEHITDEDYHVTLIDGNVYLGMVGRVRDADRWTVTPAAAPERGLAKRFRGRSYATRQSAVTALARETKIRVTSVRKGHS